MLFMWKKKAQLNRMVLKEMLCYMDIFKINFIVSLHNFQ